MVNDGVGLGWVGLGWLVGWLVGVHIRCCGHGGYRFRSYSGSLWKSPKVTKGLLPHHSAPRLGSVCPNAGLNPWAAVTGHPWPNTANPASCRVSRVGPWMARRGGPRIQAGVRAHRAQARCRVVGQRPFGYFWLGRHSGRLPKVTRCKSGTLSGRDRSNGYVHQTSHLTPLPPPCSPTHLVSGALHRVKRETGDLCLRMRSPVLPPQR